MSIDSIKHTHADRPHIPSQEEAGFEDASPVVRSEPAKAEYPKNPVVHRGQDPELFWLGKYGDNDEDDRLRVDIRSLYRTEHIAPETLIRNLHRVTEQREADLFDVNALFGNALDRDELSKVSEYYQHRDGWTNRLIQGDSLLVMTSLLEREGMAGQVQMIYIDPPYGIKYGSNWQMKLNDRTVKDGKDEHLSGEPEVIKAYRDTWELGIHSYLSYLRDRFVVALDLLATSGSVFVQIGEENVHLVRCVMDDVFGSGNFVSLITLRKTTSEFSTMLGTVSDYILWYARDIENAKFRPLYIPRSRNAERRYNQILLSDGSVRLASDLERSGKEALPEAAKRFRLDNLTSSRPTGEGDVKEFEFEGKSFTPGKGTFKTSRAGLEKLAQAGRLQATDSGKLNYRRFADDFGWVTLNNLWSDISGAVQSRSDPKRYVVQTGTPAIVRCMLLCTDPGDLVLDPTCGSGTTAYVAEQWGRRWITIDSSRIALNIAKQRLVTATFPYYALHDPDGEDIRQGFRYRVIPRITLRMMANEEPTEEVTLYDRPEENKNRLRVAGPFTVETLQSFEPIPPEELDAEQPDDEDAGRFEEQIFEHLKSAGIKNGIRGEQAVFTRVDRLAHAYLHAEGFYTSENGGESKAYIHIGPRFGSVSKKAVNEAVKAARRKGDGDWLVILGFAFESTIENQSVTTSLGQFEVTKVRMHDDLLQEGLLKKDKKAASFVTIGEPDIVLHRHTSEDGDTVTVEVRGLDIYDPIKDQVKARSKADISYWMVDDDYDGSSFVVCQVFFSGGPADAFKQWEKGLSDLAKRLAKKNVERTLKIEIDDEAFDRLYGYHSHPIPLRGEDHQIAVRVISQFGEESTKVLAVSEAG